MIDAILGSLLTMLLALCVFLMIYLVRSMFSGGK